MKTREIIGIDLAKSKFHRHIQMHWLLAGLEIVKAKPHEILRYESFV